MAIGVLNLLVKIIFNEKTILFQSFVKEKYEKTYVIDSIGFYFHCVWTKLFFAQVYWKKLGTYSFLKF